MGYWTGLVEGFQGRREAEFLKNYEREQANRQMADRVFQHLLQSRDPQMQELALSGLAQPIGRKKGLAGFMGEVESNPLMAQIVARMNEMVPEEGMGGGPAPPRPGSAAMPTNVPVRPGSEPLQLPPSPPGADAASPLGEVPPPPGPPPELTGMEAPGGMTPPPMAPPESKFKRRGTGVPTAEEIAEASATAQMAGRIKAVTTQLTAAGATPEEIQQAVLGMAGAPRNQRLLSAVTQWGVVLPGQTDPVPVLLDQTKGYVTAGGQPLPPGAKMVRMSGGSGAGLTSVIRDSPTLRAQYGIDPSDHTPSGYWRIRELPDGTVQVMPSEYTPPPAFAGTTTIAEEGTGVPTRAGIPRGGGTPVPLGDVPSEEAPQIQTDAKALIDIINRRMQEERRPGLPVRPGQRDLVTREEAQKMGLTFRSYAEVVRASQSTAPITPRERVEGGSAAERVRRRLEQGGATGPAPPPARPPVRQTGPGPRR